MCAGTTSGGDRRGRDRLCATQQRLRVSAHGRLLFNAVSRRRSRLGAANYAIRWQVEADGRGSYARCAVAIDVDVSSVLELIADAVRRQQCILFLGAGVHAPPPKRSPYEYPPEARPPIGSGLSRELAASMWSRGAVSRRGPGEPPRVALFYEIARSRQQLVDAIRTAVRSGKQPSPMLRALAELGFPLVITTNYDQLFERALAAVGKQPRVAVYTPNLEATTDHRDPTSQSPVLFKIHGDITRPETIVITDEDYIQFVLRMSNKDPYDPVPLTLKYYLTGWTTLFVGYSLLDYNLRVLFKTLRWKIDSANVPGDVLGRLPPRPAHLRRLAQPAPLREVHRPGRLDVRAQALRAGAREGVSAIAVVDERIVAVPATPVSRDPAVPLRRPPDLLRARGGDAPSGQPRLGVPRRDAVRRLGLGQVVAGQCRADPRGHAARLPSRAAARAAAARAKSS